MDVSGQPNSLGCFIPQVRAPDTHCIGGWGYQNVNLIELTLDEISWLGVVTMLMDLQIPQEL
jgi:hypothetical protein